MSTLLVWVLIRTYTIARVVAVLATDFRGAADGLIIQTLAGRGLDAIARQARRRLNKTTNQAG